jgi:hypothetical protein
MFIHDICVLFLNKTICNLLPTQNQFFLKVYDLFKVYVIIKLLKNSSFLQMAGVNNDDIQVYEMMNISSGETDDHRYETVKEENTELTYDYVGSDEYASARTTQSLPIANVTGSVGEDHMYETVDENTEIPGINVASDEYTSPRAHALQAHNGSANTCMKRFWKRIFILIALVVMAGVTISIVVILTSKPKGTLQFCNLKQNKNKRNFYNVLYYYTEYAGHYVCMLIMKHSYKPEHNAILYQVKHPTLQHFISVCGALPGSICFADFCLGNDCCVHCPCFCPTLCLCYRPKWERMYLLMWLILFIFNFTKVLSFIYIM